jgi:hypothetical protein
MGMIGRLADAAVLGSTTGPDERGQWSTNLGDGQVLAFGPDDERPGCWTWTRHVNGQAGTDGREASEEAMAEVVREAMESAGRIYHG